MAFILERYVLRHTFRAFLIGLLALTSMIFIGMSGALMRDGFNIVQVRVIIPFLLLYSLPFAVPVALLCATIFNFGRMSGDNEIIAVRSSGVLPDRLAGPVLLLGLSLSLASYWLYHWPMPSAHRTVDEQKEHMVQMLIKQVGVFQNRFWVPPYHIYVGKRDPRSPVWGDVAIFQMDEIHSEFVKRIIRAKRGLCVVSETEKLARVQLDDCILFEPQMGSQKMPVGIHTGRMMLNINLGRKRRRRTLDRPALWTRPELVKQIDELAKVAAQYPKTPRPQTMRRRLQRDHDALYRRLSVATMNLAKIRDTLRKSEEESGVVEANLEDLRRRLAATRADWSSAGQRYAKLNQEQASLRAEKAGGPPKDRVKQIDSRLAEIERALPKLQGEEQALRRALTGLTQQVRQTREGVRAMRSPSSPARLQELQMEKQCQDLQAKAADVKRRFDGARAYERLVNARIEHHSRNAAALSCFVFALIGVPLGIIARRGNVIYALAFSFGVIILIYHPMTVFAHLLAKDLFVPVALAFWAPNIVAGGLGIVLQLFFVRR